jgi:hypothetical protein
MYNRVPKLLLLLIFHRDLANNRATIHNDNRRDKALGINQECTHNKACSKIIHNET